MAKQALQWQHKTHVRSSSSCIDYASKHTANQATYGDQAMKLRLKVDQLTAKIAKATGQQRVKLEALREMTVIKMIAVNQLARS